jgi:hypothetical protein
MQTKKEIARPSRTTIADRLLPEETTGASRIPKSRSSRHETGSTLSTAPRCRRRSSDSLRGVDRSHRTHARCRAFPKLARLGLWATGRPGACVGSAGEQGRRPSFRRQIVGIGEAPDNQVFSGGRPDGSLRGSVRVHYLLHDLLRDFGWLSPAPRSTRSPSLYKPPLPGMRPPEFAGTARVLPMQLQVGDRLTDETANTRSSAARTRGPAARTPAFVSSGSAIPPSPSYEPGACTSAST